MNDTLAPYRTQFMPSSNKRTAAVKILLAPAIEQQLRALADRLGQTPATLASVAVSQYVVQQTAAVGAAERALESVFTAMGPQMLETVQKLMESPK